MVSDDTALAVASTCDKALLLREY